MHTARLVARLWVGSGQGHIGGARSTEHRGGTCGISKVRAGVLQERACSCQGPGLVVLDGVDGSTEELGGGFVQCGKLCTGLLR